MSVLQLGNWVYQCKHWLTGKDSNININASDITVGNNALFTTDNDLNINGVAQKEQTRSNNKSSSFGIGAYASTNPGSEQGASYGITANASGAKGHANSDGVSYANSHIKVGGTTTLDIGNDMTVKGGVLTTDKLTGQVAGDLNMESLQDTYVYDSKQKNAGFSADIDLSGNAQANSLSINGGKTNIDADYAAVTEQTGIYTQQSDLNVGGKGRFKGAAFTTASAEDNQSVFAQGIETSDIENYSNYDAKAIAAGITIGKAKDTGPQASLNGIGYGSDGDSQTRTTKAGVTGMAGQSDVTTDTKDSLNEPLENSFDANKVGSKVQADLEITRAFDQERRRIKTELNKDEQELRDAAKEQEALGNFKARNELLEQADKVQRKALLFDGISSALYGPNANGATGYVAKAVSPQVANQIGQYFKKNDFLNDLDNGSRSQTGSPEHLLAHALLGAAVSYATGNDMVTGGLGASAGEGTAILLTKYIYKVDKPSELTAEQKNTISSIASLAGVAIGTSTNDVSSVVNAGETGLVAVENNWGASGHYSTTAAVMYLGGFPPEVAEAIGLSAWGPDTDQRNAMTSYNVLGIFDYQEDIHLLDGETNINAIKAQQIQLENYLKRKLREVYLHPDRAASILKDINMQNSLHAYGDSFAHVQKDGTHYESGLGHLSDLTTPDDPKEHSGAYLDYVEGLQRIVNYATGKNLNNTKIDNLANSVTKKNSGDPISVIQSTIGSSVDAEPAVEDCPLYAPCTSIGWGVNREIDKLLPKK